MADFAQFSVVLTDSAGRESNVSPYVKVTDAQAFVAAANEAARDATTLGLLATRIADLSAGTLRKRYVSYGDKYTTANPDPTAEILRGNKLVFHYTGSGRGFTISIPGRDPAAYSSSGVSVDLTQLAVDDFVTAFENTATDINGNAVTVISAELND